MPLCGRGFPQSWWPSLVLGLFPGALGAAVLWRLRIVWSKGFQPARLSHEHLMKRPDDGLWQRIFLATTALGSAVGSPAGDVHEEWCSGSSGVHLCGTRGGIPDAHDGVPRCALQPGDLQCGSEFRGHLKRDALAVVPAVGKRWWDPSGSPLRQAAACWRGATFLSERMTLRSGMSSWTLTTKRCTLATAAWPPDARTTLSEVVGNADEG